MPEFQIQSPVFGAGDRIPRRYTQDGQNVSPALSWSNVPPSARELALIVDDPDAPTPDPWVHWLLYRLAPGVTALPEGVPPSERVADPPGALQGRNSWNRIGYGGPAPPKGHGLHHYRFKLYALDAPLNLPPGASKQELLEAMKGHVLAEAELVGTYSR